MNPQILQLLMSNPQMLASLIQQSQQMSQPAQQPSWKTADYYGPEAQREQYFKNMGVDTSPAPASVVAPPAPPPASVQSGGFGSKPNFNPYGEATPAPSAAPVTPTGQVVNDLTDSYTLPTGGMDKRDPNAGSQPWPQPQPQPNFGFGGGRSGFNSPFGRSMLQINPMSNPRPGRSMYRTQAPASAPQAGSAGGPNNPFGSQNPFGAPTSSATPAYRR